MFSVLESVRQRRGFNCDKALFRVAPTEVGTANRACEDLDCVHEPAVRLPSKYCQAKGVLIIFVSVKGKSPPVSLDTSKNTWGCAPVVVDQSIRRRI